MLDKLKENASAAQDIISQISFSAQCFLAPLSKTGNFPTHPGITSGEDDGGKDSGQVEEKDFLSE